MHALDRRLTPAESYARRKWAGHLPVRKRKKRRKKLPKASSFWLPRRPCAHAAHALAVQVVREREGAPFSVHRQSAMRLHTSGDRGCALAASQVMAGSARRRWDRQLRAWHRHVRVTVAMELATALHHSAQRVEVPREGNVHEKHDGPRPLQGTRPGLPTEQEACRRASHEGGVGDVCTLVPTSPALLVVLFWVEEEEEKEIETDESKAVDVLWVLVQLLFLTSLMILFFSYSRILLRLVRQWIHAWRWYSCGLFFLRHFVPGSLFGVVA